MVTQNQGNRGWFVVGQMVEEDGWRDFSGTEVYRLFSKVTALTDNGEINFSITAAENTLRGNGVVPAELAEGQQRGQHVHRGGLAGAVGAEKSECGGGDGVTGDAGLEEFFLEEVNRATNPVLR